MREFLKFMNQLATSDEPIDFWIGAWLSAAIGAIVGVIGLVFSVFVWMVLVMVGWIR